ncbi:hypothetical protein F4604DRAFT_1922214 [Suillus subluteus]|nr:hypothetical protein F4604DRAFT_1922214 [Suillus subluteus]
MSVLHTPPTSPSDSQTSGNGFQPLTLTQADIAATMSMAVSRIRASISQYQMEAAHTEEPSAAQIMHFKAGLQWEIATFVTPILQYSAARNIISVVPSPVAHILQLIPELTWNMVPDHIFSSHLCRFQDVADLGDPSRIVSTYGAQWWTGPTAILNELWPWDQVFANCVCHYQHWLSGVEDERLVVPEQVDESSVATLKALKWMRECLLTVIEDQQAGICEKMAEIQMYTAVLTKLKPRGPDTENYIMTFKYLTYCYMQSPAYQISSPEHRVPNFEAQISRHEVVSTINHRVPEHRVPTPNTQHPTPDTRHPTPDTQHPTPDT